MKTYCFPYGGSFGPRDSWDGSNEVELSDRDAKRLVTSAKKEPRWRLDEDPEISDIYDKVSRRLFKKELEELLNDEYRIQELREDYESEYGRRKISDRGLAEKYLDGTTFNINYPEELQNLEI